MPQKPACSDIQQCIRLNTNTMRRLYIICATQQLGDGAYQKTIYNIIWRSGEAIAPMVVYLQLRYVKSFVCCNATKRKKQNATPVDSTDSVKLFKYSFSYHRRCSGQNPKKTQWQRHWFLSRSEWHDLILGYIEKLHVLQITEVHTVPKIQI